MGRAERTADATAWLQGHSDTDLLEVTCWDVVREFRLRWDEAERLLHGDKLRRGLITVADLSPRVRRALLNPEALDLHAIAAGPIMDSNQIFLPAGKLSLEQTRAREAAALLEARHG